MLHDTIISHYASSSALMNSDISKSNEYFQNSNYIMISAQLPGSQRPPGPSLRTQSPSRYCSSVPSVWITLPERDFRKHDKVLRLLALF